MQILAEDVRKTYGSVVALDGLDLEIPEGATFGVLGTNGAGKTTLFELLVGLEQPDGGRLTIGDRDVERAGASIRRRVGYLPERIGFPGALTGREVLEFHCRMRGLDDDGRIDEALETIGLSRGDAGRAVEGYSNGMRRRLGLASIVLAEPAVLILDEPTAGLDPRGVAEFHEVIRRARKRTGATVVVASHVLSEIEELCDRVAILDDGAVIAAGEVHELVETDRVTVRLRPASAGELTRMAAMVGELGTTTRSDGVLRVETDLASIPSLFAGIDSRTELAEATVEREGLDAVFHRALEVGDKANLKTTERADG